MTINVRLDRATERMLEAMARDQKRTRSAIVRDAIAALARGKGGSEPATGSLYHRMQPYIGVINTGGSLLARNRKTRLGTIQGRVLSAIRRHDIYR